MLKPSPRRKLVVLTLAGALLLPVLATANPRTRVLPARTEAPRPAATSFLRELGTALVTLWKAAGCELDPSGLCADNPGEPGPSGAHSGHGNGLGVHGNPLDQ